MRGWEKLAMVLETIKKWLLDDLGKREKVVRFFPVPLHALVRRFFAY